MLTAGVAVQSTSQDSSSPGPLANRATAAGRSLQLAGTWASRKTDHFDIYYPPDLDLHAERVGREAERAYEHVSSDLKHNLAFRVPILLFPTAGDFEKATQAGGSERPQATSATNPEGDRILLAVDQPADQWYGRIVHEVAHVFAFDILPGTATPRWIMEGLAEYERPAWDPDDLVALRAAVRTNAVPALSAGRVEDNSRDARRDRCPRARGVRLYRVAMGEAGRAPVPLRASAERAQRRRPVRRCFSDQARRVRSDVRTVSARAVCSAAAPSWAPRFDYRPSVQIEGEITSLRAPVEKGLACIELLVSIRSGPRNGGASSAAASQRLTSCAASSPAIASLSQDYSPGNRREWSCSILSGHQTATPGARSPSEGEVVSVSVTPSETPLPKGR